MQNSTDPHWLWLGLMSGTSTDGVDGVVASFDDAGGCRVLAHASYPFMADLRAQWLDLQSLSGPFAADPYLALESATAALTAVYIDCAKALMAMLPPSERPRVRAAGAHGQTLRHRPDLGLTRQCFNPALFHADTGLSVVSDFRRADVALGGQGAPLVPAFHAWWVDAACPGHGAVAVLNVGGFANLTLLPPVDPSTGAGQTAVLGFDTGPGNVLMDAWIGRHQALGFDAGGVWAASGRVHDALVEALLAHPFFHRVKPKSTGRDEFNLQWLDSVLAGFPGVSAVDVQASLLELTVRSVLAELPADCQRLWICGGGAYNTALVKRLAMGLPATQVETTDTLGVPPSQVEALAFAWLARQRLCGRPGNLPSVTGARQFTLLGCLTGL